MCRGRKKSVAKQLEQAKSKQDNSNSSNTNSSQNAPKPSFSGDFYTPSDADMGCTLMSSNYLQDLNDMGIPKFQFDIDMLSTPLDQGESMDVPPMKTNRVLLSPAGKNTSAGTKARQAALTFKSSGLTRKRKRSPQDIPSSQKLAKTSLPLDSADLKSFIPALDETNHTQPLTLPRPRDNPRQPCTPVKSISNSKAKLLEEAPHAIVGQPQTPQSRKRSPSTTPFSPSCFFASPAPKKPTSKPKPSPAKEPPSKRSRVTSSEGTPLKTTTSSNTALTSLNCIDNVHSIPPVDDDDSQRRRQKYLEALIKSDAHDPGWQAIQMLRQSEDRKVLNDQAAMILRHRDITLASATAFPVM